jgi:hypothetical protein
LTGEYSLTNHDMPQMPETVDVVSPT